MTERLLLLRGEEQVVLSLGGDVLLLLGHRHGQIGAPELQTIHFNGKGWHKRVAVVDIAHRAVSKSPLQQRDGRVNAVQHPVHEQYGHSVLLRRLGPLRGGLRRFFL